MGHNNTVTVTMTIELKTYGYDIFYVEMYRCSEVVCNRGVLGLLTEVGIKDPFHLVSRRCFGEDFAQSKCQEDIKKILVPKRHLTYTEPYT